MFKPVREAQANGGFKFETPNGDIVHAYPVMCLFVADTPERQLLSLIFNSAKSAHPCSLCDIAGPDFPNLQLGFETPLRQQADTNMKRLECLAAGNTQQKLKEISVHGEESGFRGLYSGAHPHGPHLFVGPDIMHMIDEGWANTIIECVTCTLHDAGVLSDVNTTLAKMHIRSHDPEVKFTWVRNGLQSLTCMSAMDMPGVVNSLILALGVYTRGSDSNLPLRLLLVLQRILYLFCAMHRNMKMRDHTEQEIDDLATLVLLLSGTFVIVLACWSLAFIPMNKLWLLACAFLPGSRPEGSFPRAPPRAQGRRAWAFLQFPCDCPYRGPNQVVWQSSHHERE
jgi:hypothetical protein